MSLVFFYFGVMPVPVCPTAMAEAQVCDKRFGMEFFNFTVHPEERIRTLKYGSLSLSKA